MDVRRLIDDIADQEDRFRQQLFVAPTVARGKVKARVAGLVQSFVTHPRSFEGWGVFQANQSHQAVLQEQASPAQRDGYLRLLKPLRLRLVMHLFGSLWLAYPSNESDARQRFGLCQPLPVALVSEGQAFEPILARHDGSGFWFDQIDRREHPRHAEQLRQALSLGKLGPELSWADMTPEMVTVYTIVAERLHALGQGRDEARLKRALATGGGELLGFTERDDHWVVEWIDSRGQRHTSAISRSDLTVLSAGICLAGEDEKFDLESLVGVVEGSDEWDYYD